MYSTQEEFLDAHYKEAMDRGESHMQYIIGCISGYNPDDNLVGAQEDSYYELDDLSEKMQHIQDTADGYNIPYFTTEELQRIIDFLDNVNIKGQCDRFHAWNKLA